MLSKKINPPQVMSSDKQQAANDAPLLRTIVHHLQRYKPHVYDNTQEDMRYASVSIVLRLQHSKPHIGDTNTNNNNNAAPIDLNLEEFLQQAHHGRLEVLYMLRQTRPGDPWSGHVAFPGGKRDFDQDGHSASLTAIRETREEIGIDLTPKKYAYIGRLDDLVVGFGTRMIVSPFGE